MNGATPELAGIQREIRSDRERESPTVANRDIRHYRSRDAGGKRVNGHIRSVYENRLPSRHWPCAGNDLE